MIQSRRQTDRYIGSSFRRLSMLMALSLTCVPALATAQERAAENEEPKPMGDPKAEFNILYNQGLDALAAQDWRKAYDILNRVWKTEQSADVAGLLGHAERNLGRCASAIPHLELALKEPLPTQTEAENQRIRGWLKDCQNRIGTLQIDAPPGLELFVDGIPVGTAPLTAPIPLDPGDHAVEARGQQRVVASGAATIRAQAQQKLILSPVAVQPSESVVSRVPPSPPDDSRLAAPQKRPSLLVSYIAGAVAVAGAASGIVFALRTRGVEEDMETRGNGLARSRCASGVWSAECADLKSLGQRQAREATIQDVSFAVSGVAAVTAVGWLTYALLRPTENRSAAVNVRVDGRGGQLTLNGAF